MPVEYLRRAFDPKSLKKIADYTFKTACQVDADIIVARGLSGTIIAAAVGAMHGMPFGIVRKPTESGHSSAGIEVTEHLDGYTTPVYHNYLIVDDFICTGATMQAIEREVRNYEYKISGDCEAIVLYNSTDQDRLEWTINGHDAPIYRIDWNNE